MKQNKFSIIVIDVPEPVLEENLVPCKYTNGIVKCLKPDFPRVNLIAGQVSSGIEPVNQGPYYIRKIKPNNERN